MKRNLDHTHRDRTAYVYVRQSTAAQILEHTESTKRQYGLVERAHALGWSPSAIEVIDEDQGKSGASGRERDGFARLVDAVVRGEAGAILAVEVSRLSRRIGRMKWKLRGGSRTIGAKGTTVSKRLVGGVVGSLT
jgi:DNA invertase Pin-like site-specific DNA recombinase